MATEILKNLTNEGTHNVGSISSIQVKTLAHGAKVTDTNGLDNWVLAQLDGFDDEGTRKCKAYASGTQAYLVATVEQRFLGEDIGHFYNDKGEIARLVLLEAGYTRFEASNFTKADTSKDIKLGQAVHYDASTKKYIISNGDSNHSGYTDATFKFEVVGDLDDTAGNFLQDTVRFMYV